MDSLIEEGHHLGRARGVAPVAHELEGDGEHGDDLDARGAHAVVGVLRGLHVERSGGVAVRPDAVTCIAKGEREERCADLQG